MTTGRAVSEPELRARIAELAEQVRRLSAARRPPPAREPLAARADAVAVDVIAMAERAAAEIRASARREAARLGGRAPDELPAGSGELLVDTVGRQRVALGALAAEADRIGHSAAVLRDQLRALEADLHRLHELLSAPGASRGTSPRRHG